MTIYLDVVLFENILMNILIIYFANYLSKRKIGIYKMCISAIIGAVYYVMILLPTTNFLNFYLYKLGLSVIMVLIGFNSKTIFEFVSNIMFFYISSFIFGGAMYGIYYLISTNTNIEYYPVKMILLCILIVSIGIKNVAHYIHVNSKYSKLIYKLDIYIENKMKRITAFLDTGNSLKDTITNKPIIVVNLNSIRDILPEEICNIANKGIENISNISDNRIHLIPYISVGNQNGMMIGYRIDKVIIHIENEESLKINSAILGINTTNLNGIRNADSLISIEILEKGGVLNEYRKIKVG